MFFVCLFFLHYPAIRITVLVLTWGRTTVRSSVGGSEEDDPSASAVVPTSFLSFAFNVTNDNDNDDDDDNDDDARPCADFV